VVYLIAMVSAAEGRFFVWVVELNSYRCMHGGSSLLTMLSRSQITVAPEASVQPRLIACRTAACTEEAMQCDAGRDELSNGRIAEL